MYLQSITIFYLVLVQASHCRDDIHTFMSQDQIREVFQTDADSVQEHEIVGINFPERLHKRQLSTGMRLSIRAFGDDINLWLYPRDSILFGENTPVYLAKYSPHEKSNVTFRLQNGLMKRVGQLLEDRRHSASVVIGTEAIDGRRRINGYIGSKRLAIRSVSQSVVREYLRKRRSIDDIDDASNYHVVYRTNEDIVKNHSPPVVDKIMLEERVPEATPPPQIPAILYPEILVIVENSIYREQGRDIYALLEYLLAFWNGVDLKYRSLEGPRVRLHISAIIMGENPEATPYISNNMLSATVFHADDALEGGRKFFYAIKDTFPFDSYDLALTMSRYTMNDNYLGIAYHGGACKIDDAYKSTNRAALALDKGGFEGVSRAAHEMGHTFGMFDEYIRGKCSFKYGFVMSGFGYQTENSSSFSECSLNDFQQYLDGQNLKCLYNVPPRFGKDLPKLMPGKVMNLGEQCKAHFVGSEGESCKPYYLKVMDICVNFYCKMGRSCDPVGAGAADGTPCGDENDILPRFCLHQKCVRW